MRNYVMASERDTVDIVKQNVITFNQLFQQPSSMMQSIDYDKRKEMLHNVYSDEF